MKPIFETEDVGRNAIPLRHNPFLVRDFQSLDRRPDGITGSVVRYLDQHVIMAKCDAHFVNDERCDRGFTRPSKSPDLVAATETDLRVRAKILI